MRYALGMNELFLATGSALFPGFGMFVALLLIWTIPWKGYALWLAARNNHPWWFVILLVVNTVAILEIIYIFAIGRLAQKEKLESVAK